MKPIKFEEVNAELQKPPNMTDEECQPLPVFRDGEECISCWQPTWKERLSILIYGKVWLGVLFGKSQPPVRLKGSKTFFEK